MASTSGAHAPTAAEAKSDAVTVADLSAVWVKNAALEVTRLIDDGRVELAGVPWVHPAEPTHKAEDLHTRKRSEGEDGLSHEDLCSLVVQPSVFVWAPDLLFPG